MATGSCTQTVDPGQLSFHRLLCLHSFLPLACHLPQSSISPHPLGPVLRPPRRLTPAPTFAVACHHHVSGLKLFSSRQAQENGRWWCRLCRRCARRRAANVVSRRFWRGGRHHRPRVWPPSSPELQQRRWPQPEATAGQLRGPRPRPGRAQRHHRGQRRHRRARRPQGPQGRPRRHGRRRQAGGHAAAAHGQADASGRRLQDQLPPRWTSRESLRRRCLRPLPSRVRFSPTTLHRRRSD